MSCKDLTNFQCYDLVCRDEGSATVELGQQVTPSHPPPPPPYSSSAKGATGTQNSSNKGAKTVLVSDQGICFSNISQIDINKLSIISVNDSKQICYGEESRLYFVSEAMLGKLKVYENDEGYSPKIAILNPPNGLLNCFKTMLEEKLNKKVHFYVKNQKSAQLNVFINCKRIDGERVISARIDGTNEMISVDKLNSLSGSFKVLLKVGKVKDDKVKMMWSVSAEEISVDTTVDTANHEDFAPKMKFLHMM